MRRRREQKHEVTGLIALVLFGVFAVCVLSVLLTGADVYHRLTVRDREAYARRTGIQYVATKVRQAQAGSAVAVSDFGGVDALELYEDIDGERYVTRIYSYDGWLRELFTAVEGEFLPGDGEKVIEAGDMELTLDSGLLDIALTDGTGTETQLVLSLRGEEAAP